MISNLNEAVAINFYVDLFPDWLIKKEIPRKLASFFLPGVYKFRDEVWSKFYPFMLNKIKEHKDNLGMRAFDHLKYSTSFSEEGNPGDYIDFLILENLLNGKIDYHVIAESILHLG